MDIEFWEHTENIQKALKSPSLQSISKRWKPCMISKLFGDDHDVPS